MLEEMALEEAVERAVLKARPWKAADNELVAAKVVPRRQNNTGCGREKRDEQ